MTKQQIFDYFYTNSASFDVQTLVVIMCAGLAVASVVFLTYWITYRGVAYNARFNATLVVISLISVVIMLMISSNIVISLGMVGALSIVRFRTAVKDSRDTVFIFWAITEGLCVGSQNMQLAVVTTLFIAIVIIAVTHLPRGKKKYLLAVSGEQDPLDMGELVRCLESKGKGCTVRSVTGGEGHQEAIVEVMVRGELSPDFIHAVYEVPGVTSFNWLSETGDTLG